ncbi:MAG: ABC transporter permease [Brevinematia bacterium]
MFFEIIKDAYRSILKNKLRSFLTMLGVVIGITSVVVMVSIGLGVQKQVESQIGSMGVNLITVFPGTFRQGGVSMGLGSASRLTIADIEKIKREATLIDGISPLYRINSQIVGPAGNWYTSVYGVSEDYFKIRNWDVISGEVFNEMNVRTKSKVCVIGYTVATNLFGNGNITGEEVRIQGNRFKILGVLTPKGASGGMSDQDDVVLVPYTTFESRISRSRFIGQILVSAASQEQMSACEEEIRNILRESHKLSENADDDFTIRNQTDILETFNQTTMLLTIFLASIAGISLIVGGVGIMNIMLVTVRERTREIGIRIAVGAKEKDILLQFLSEAVILCLTGGLIGMFLGVFIGFGVEKLFNMKVVFSLPVFLVAFVFSLGVGVFFGFYPARKAAELNPIEALRYE